MSKIKIISILGVWLTALPYLGFPLSIKNILISFSALFILYLNYLVYRNSGAGEQKKEAFDSFSENSDFKENK